MEYLVFSYLAMTLIQVFHIFEEIWGKLYEIIGTLPKYLIAASILVTLNFVFLALIIAELRIGYILGMVGAFMAIINGLVHTVGYIKTRTFRQGIGAGFFTGIPLAIVGACVLWQLVQIIF